MKKILLAILTISASTFFNAANAQWCGTVSSCIGSPTTQPGFPAPDSLPCVHQGVAYNSSVSFKMFSSFNYLGQHQLDSVTVDTIYNLPCGLCWSLNKASKTYSPNEIGCMSFFFSIVCLRATLK